jgi:HD superfamily phosphohydrolase YqeK
MPGQLIDEACDLIARILEDDPARLHHCAGVAALAQTLVSTVPVSAADTVVASAWLA